METFSYHIFHYPFRWSIEQKNEALLSEQINLDNIIFSKYSMWERVQKPDANDAEDVYNEKNYYFKFVHNILYDSETSTLNLIRHYERKESKIKDNVTYKIKVKGRDKPYILKVDAININFYSTGIGVMSFFLANNIKEQSAPQDVLNINQYGRRIMPPFIGDLNLRSEIAEYISIEGLEGNKTYFEDFNDYKSSDSWKPASFINMLINEIATNITCEPVIDDRMFVCSWYKNDILTETFTNNANAYLENEEFSNFWYKYVFVDGGSLTCQNNEMQKKFLTEQTYSRWQKWSSLYGMSRYSMVYLTSNTVPGYLLKYFTTIYSRMIELVLVQRASILRFSYEVTQVSTLKTQKTNILAERVNSLYKEYIQFLNQIYFREITAQDQGIELYTMFQKTLDLDNYIKDLDGEIEELHNYISIKIESKRSRNGEWLNKLATIFLPATLITGIFGMNPFTEDSKVLSFVIQFIAIIVFTIASIIYINRKSK